MNLIQTQILRNRDGSITAVKVTTENRSMESSSADCIVKLHQGPIQGNSVVAECCSHGNEFIFAPPNTRLETEIPVLPPLKSKDETEYATEITTILAKYDNDRFKDMEIEVSN